MKSGGRGKRGAELEWRVRTYKESGSGKGVGRERRGKAVIKPS